MSDRRTHAEATQISSPSDLLDIKDAAARLEISVRTLERRVADGEIEAVRVTTGAAKVHKRFFRIADLDALLRQAAAS